ncbi:hypothetical protein HXY33_05965 [Candidatus Bathyarchaeota archaeon]|nr:hypothetical protein [Candidatus Bathyarchaeota archaeon]
MPSPKVHTALLGLAFLLFLLLSYIENTFFFQTISGKIINNHILFLIMLFTHNVLAVSLILLGMTFYVNLVLSDFFKREKHANIILEHPRIFALVFALMIIILSILRGSSLLGGINIEALPVVLLVSAPVGIVEGYGIYLTIKKTLGRNMSMKDLAYIYGIFFIAALMEVAFINILLSIVT